MCEKYESDEDTDKGDEYELSEREETEEAAEFGVKRRRWEMYVMSDRCESTEKCEIVTTWGLRWAPRTRIRYQTSGHLCARSPVVGVAAVAHEA
jgi:hypothetical protein